MDVAAVMKEVETWSLEERVALLQRLAEKLSKAGHTVGIDSDLKDELDRRLISFQANPDDVQSWEDIRSSLKHAG